MSASNCSICGAILPGQAAPTVTVNHVPPPRPRYDPAAGDDDLYAGDLMGRMWRLVMVAVVVMTLAFGVGIGYLLGRMSTDDANDGEQGVNSQVQTQELMPDSALGASAAAQDSESGATAPPTATTRGAGYWNQLTQDANRQVPSDLALETGGFVTQAPAGEPALDAGGFVSQTPAGGPALDAMPSMPTVTPGPPTETPRPEMCLQQAREGDTLSALIFRCQYESYDTALVDEILRLNNMDSAAELQIGQTVEIPWPEPLAPPADTSFVPSGEGVEVASALTVAVNEFGTPDALAMYANIEPTLRPGQAWHTVQQGQTLYDIIAIYETSAQTLSQLNPEVPFYQCDFGKQFGGQNCDVMLYENMRMRVPVPLPTPTLSPTPAGTLTPTPTATPVFNAPYTLRPPNEAHFFADERVTLRWGGTGTLGPNERYLVRVMDMDLDEENAELVADTMFVLPDGWQPADGEPHTFEWSIAVATIDDQFNVIAEEHRTPVQQFTWDSR
ncbi:MAG: LysM peptidoglycan-binding domain-containing protein [Chloroflexi bacterium]|nr:LysM peptidoglycan-binding domain-containing protein [Chloroflexota bacterium]